MFSNMTLRQKRVVVSLLSIVLLGGAVLTATGLTVLGHHPNKAHAASTISVALNRYYNDNSNDPESQTHATTTGAAPTNFYYEGTLAHLFLNTSTGRVALYSCVETSPTTLTTTTTTMADDGDGDGLDVSTQTQTQTPATHSDYFVSTDGNCEGHGAGQVLGYVLPQGSTEMVALYRCVRTVSTGLDHFVSTDAACEGAKVDGLLGYGYPAAIVADCGGSNGGYTQSDVNSILSDIENRASFTSEQQTALSSNPCLLINALANPQQSYQGQFMPGSVVASNGGKVCQYGGTLVTDWRQHITIQYGFGIPSQDIQSLQWRMEKYVCWDGKYVTIHPDPTFNISFFSGSCSGQCTYVGPQDVTNKGAYVNECEGSGSIGDPQSADCQGTSHRSSGQASISIGSPAWEILGTHLPNLALVYHPFMTAVVYGNGTYACAGSANTSCQLA